MAYFIDLFSPETYEAFSRSDQTVTGFRVRQENAARRVKVGDKFICYMTKLSRWCGVLEVVSDYYHDTTPRFYVDGDDPFVIRFHVRPLAWLPKEKAIPIRADHVWPNLSFTREYDINTPYWTGKLRSSLGSLDEQDGRFLEQLILAQVNSSRVYELDDSEYEKLLTHRVRRLDKTVSVSVPREGDADPSGPTPFLGPLGMQVSPARG